MIEILAAGPVTSVQDLGRTGYRAMGVGEAGAMDRLSLRVANLLVGNAAGDACIETALAALRVRFTGTVRFAVAGAPARVSLDGTSLPSFWSAVAEAGQVVAFEPSPVATWSYLAIAGGIDVPSVLGSRSTDLKGRYGGHQGRALAAGDRLAHRTPPSVDAIGARSGGFGVEPPRGSITDGASVIAVRAIPAREAVFFGAEARSAFWTAEWIVQPNSNRIGYQLGGPRLEPLEPLDLLSYGLIPGVVQVPPAGQPVVQLSDGNTCGGYPKMAVVIGADLRLLAQTRPGRAVRFVETGPEDAVRTLAEDQHYLEKVAQDVRGRMARGGGA